MGCNERVGNMFLLLCLTHTTDGIALLKPGWDTHNITQKQFKNRIKLQLGFQKWIHEYNDKDEVDSAGPLLGELIDMIKYSFPREEGNGWKIPKVHALATILHFVQKFGCASGFSGETGERFLKTIVKDMARITQQRAGLFAEQCAFRLFEKNVFKHAYQCSVVPGLGLDFDKIENDNNVEECQGSGEYTFTIEDVDRHGRGYTKVVWKSPDREKLKIGISELMKLSICKFAADNNWKGMFQVTGYTSFKLHPEGYDEPILFHANEFTRGDKWYDWCMLQFDGEEGDHPLDEDVCPALILGFFKYASSGMPTPYLIDEMGYSPQHIYENGMEDDTPYAVVHTASDMVPWRQIKDEFVSSFQLGDVKSCVFIVDIDCIIDPLFVFKDLGGKGSASSRHFCVLPYAKWGRYFGNKVVRLPIGDDDSADLGDEEVGDGEGDGGNEMTTDDDLTDNSGNDDDSPYDHDSE